MITVVDYGMGNLRSLRNALEYIGTDVNLDSSPESIRKAERLIIPGVGAFGDAIRNLAERELIACLNEAALERKVPVLGICLGMQLMADSSEEHGQHRGLGWIPGRVVQLTPQNPALKVPHVGWNDIELRAASNPLFAELGNTAHRTFYFVHSYHVVCDDPKHVLATCNHGQDFSAVVGHDNIIAAQFHPEKSQDNGLQLLRNFLEWRAC